MDTAIRAWMDAERVAGMARITADQALERAVLKAVLPNRFRRAEAADITLGSVIWYLNDGEPFWALVTEVLRPNDTWKAYEAHDGCRYGLEDAYVEID
jgi:hypothetical protein